MKRLFLILSLLSLVVIGMSGQTQPKRYKFYYSYEQEEVLNSKPGRMPMYYKGTPYTEIVPVDSVYTSKFSDVVYLGEGTVEEDVTFTTPPDLIRIDSTAYKLDNTLWTFYSMSNPSQIEDFTVFFDVSDNEIDISWKGDTLTVDEIKTVVEAVDQDKTCLILIADENHVSVVGCKHGDDVGTAIWYTFKSRFRK